MKIKPGLKFRSNFADGMSEWTVINKITSDRYYANNDNVWVCRIMDENEDWGGTVKSFFENEIINAINFQNNIDNLFSEQEKWYKGLKANSILHYNNGFDTFVRCKVVVENGENKLLPIALVGNWKEYDLPKIDINGEVNIPYHCNKIFNRETFTPSFTCVYESPVYDARRDRINPANEVPIDLTIPEQTPEQKEKVRLNKILYKIDEVLHDIDAKKEKLNRIYSLIKDEVDK